MKTQKATSKNITFTKKISAKTYPKKKIVEFITQQELTHQKRMRIYQIIEENQPVSIPKIVRLSGMAPRTVNSYLKDIKVMGLVGMTSCPYCERSSVVYVVLKKK